MGTVRVKAVFNGTMHAFFYGQRLFNDDEFEISDEKIDRLINGKKVKVFKDFNPRWMKVIDDHAKDVQPAVEAFRQPKPTLPEEPEEDGEE